MVTRIGTAVEVQRRYYAATAANYESMHACEGVSDPSLLRYLAALLNSVNTRSILEVGTATGRGLRVLKDILPEALVCGIEPVGALLDRASALGYRAGTSLIQGIGETLPFRDQSFDVVCEFGTLHHVPDPALVVQEMLRVARKAVLIADSNRFGQGSMVRRLLKLAIYKAGAWNAFNFLRTRGKRYLITEGDGLAYSYSVFDSYDLVAGWANRVMLIPAARQESRSWFHPLLSSGGVCLFGFRERA